MFSVNETNFMLRTSAFYWLIILLIAPISALAKAEPVAGLTFFRENQGVDSTVEINGYTWIDQQSIISPSVIETSFDKMQFIVSFGANGRIKLGPGTKMILAFDANRISGFLFTGNLIVSVSPDTTVNIQTRDGVIKTSGQYQKHSVAIDFVKGKTRVETLSGVADLNGISIAAEHYFIAGDPATNYVNLQKNAYFITYLVIPVALILSGVLDGGNESDDNIENVQIVIGPMR